MPPASDSGPGPRCTRRPPRRCRSGRRTDRCRRSRRLRHRRDRRSPRGRGTGQAAEDRCGLATAGRAGEQRVFPRQCDPLHLLLGQIVVDRRRRIGVCVERIRAECHANRHSLAHDYSADLDQYCDPMRRLMQQTHILRRRPGRPALHLIPEVPGEPYFYWLHLRPPAVRLRRSDSSIIHYPILPRIDSRSSYLCPCLQIPLSFQGDPSRGHTFS